MSSASDFVIESGILKQYVGPGGDVIIPEGVTSIGDHAFAWRKTVTSVTIPDSVTSIGSSAFYYCKSLTNITIPEGVSYIDSSTFEGCSSLTSVTIPKSAKIIGYGAFGGCSSLTSVMIPEGVMSIDSSAFSGCSSLTSVTIPRSVTRVGSEAFSGCSSLRSLNMNESCAILSKDVFGSSALPTGLIPQVGSLYDSMADSALKQYVLEEKTWKRLNQAVRTEIFLARQGKALESAYEKCVDASELEELGAAILGQLGAQKPTPKDCTAAVVYMTLFHKNAPIGMLEAMYEKLRSVKAGAKAVKTVEAHVALMEKLGSKVKIDDSLSPAAQKTMQVMIAEKKNAKDTKNALKEYYNLVSKDLPVLHATNGSEVEPLVFAWLLTAHEKQMPDGYGSLDVVAGHETAGLRPEAAEVVALIDQTSLQAALLMLADACLGSSGRSKKMFIAWPICRYADEGTMKALTAKAPKWASSTSGIDAPGLYNFRKAALYSNTRAAMFFADKMGDLDEYAALRGLDADTFRDRYLSNVGLDKQGGKAYDLGNQIVTVRLQKDLSLLIELPSGKTAKSLPKKNADPRKYEAACADFSEMKKTIKAIVKNRKDRLLREFLSGKERSADAWREAYLNNPLLRIVAETMVWSQDGTCFTLDNDSLVDSLGRSCVLSERPVKLAHPMEMEWSERESWQRFFVAHRRKQPFLQIWEPVRRLEELQPDRYKDCTLPFYRFRGMEKHGFILKTSYGDIFGNNHTMQITDLSTVDGLIEGGGVSETWETPAAITLGKLHIESYTRQVNHIVALLDQWTAADRVRKDDLGVMELMDDFTLAQITEFIAAAQEANANNVLAALLDYKNAHFADFDPMAEFTLEW